MPLTLEEFDHQVGRHLEMIRQCADAICRHTRDMTHRPNFEAWAEGDLVKAHGILVEAADKVSKAMDRYREKPRDR